MQVEDRKGSLTLVALILLFGAASSPAAAFEFADGRVQVHGFYESQMRAIARNYSTSDDWDLTQWAHILNIEIEADIAPDGWGPFDLVSAFARVEARYDCVWTRGCGMFSSADTYGNRAARLPGRLGDGERAGYRNSATLVDGDQRRFASIPREFLFYDDRNRGDSAPSASDFFNIQGLDTLFGVAGQNEIFGDEDDPAPFIFNEILDNCVFAFRDTRGPENGTGSQVLGPWNPDCRTREQARLSARPNPMRSGDISPILEDDAGNNIGGFGELPMRPVPDFNYLGTAPLDQAKGIYLPNQELARKIRGGDFGDTDQDFSQDDLAWNHGASQSGERELKELYVDMEFFDSRLWIRAGKQTIVWGKTELFRTTDQFNPQDLALASLPSLEESRVALWAARGVWSFYTLGPFDDLRLELAANYDEFEPNDLGRCGEPYSPLPVCSKTFGLFIHGLTGLGVGGEVRPENPWDSWKGWEVGARLEGRWKRFSFALTDFYGYHDLPHQERLFTYSRNIDPVTGRPRHTMANGPCTTGAEESCLQVGTSGPNNALQFHSVNQQLFAMICSTSVGIVPGLDPTACGQTAFNSQVFQGPITIASLVTNLLAGNIFANGLASGGLAGGTPLPFLGLSVDPCDGFLEDCTTPGPPPDPFISSNPAAFGITWNQVTTVQQQALFGCGDFYGTNCEAEGIDLMNTEATALMQAWPGIEGAGGLDWETTDATIAQPGTVGFDQGPVCTRVEGGPISTLPGCRGTTDSDYDINVDGDPSGLVHPFFDPTSDFYQGVPPDFDATFRTELGAASFNALMALVALSTPVDQTGDGIPDATLSRFDPDEPFRDEGCSFRRPHLCSNVQSVVQYEKRNVLGLSLDWAEDVTKTNWGIETTWIEGLQFTDLDELDRLSDADTYNLTVSIDRPTFINFLNPNRTFFLNMQSFFQYVDGYRKGFTSNGPWNALVTFTIQTGFFRDRFLPHMTFVYDFRSASGAWLPSFQYRYTENLSVTFGLALFSGRSQSRQMAIAPTSLQNRAAAHRDSDFVENGLSVVRERDEVFLKIRYTF
jgi:hypothetical protein